MLEHLSTVDACRFCWMCRHVCPAGLVTKEETTTTRGWALQLSMVARGQLALEGRTVDSLYHCLQCGLCEAWCVPGFDPYNAIRAARAESVRAGTAPAEVVEVAAHLDDHATPFHSVPGAPFVAAPVAGQVRRDPQPTPPHAWPRPQPTPDLAEPVYLMAGCVETSLLPSLNDALARVLQRAGVRLIVPDHAVCCGSIPYDLGLDDQAVSLSRATAEGLRAACGSGADTLLVTGHQCRRVMTERYGDWEADLHGARILSPAAVLRSLVEAGRLRLGPISPMRAVLQDPCRCEPATFDDARTLLEAIPGLTLLELASSRERAQCCGGAGGITLTHPEVARGQAIRQLEGARWAGADAIITASPICRYALGSVQESVTDVHVVDLVELVDHATRRVALIPRTSDVIDPAS